MGQKPLASQPGSRLCGRRGPRPARVTTSRWPLPAALPASPGGRQVACRATRLQRAGVAEGTKGFRGEGAPGPSRAGMQGGAGEHAARWKQVSDVRGGGSGGRVHVGVMAAARSLTAPPPRSPGQPSGARGSVQSSRSLRTLCPSFASGDPALLGVLLLRPVHIHYLGHTSSLAHPEVSLLGPVPSHPPPSTSCACDSRPPTPARARAHTHTQTHTPGQPARARPLLCPGLGLSCPRVCRPLHLHDALAR